ncbi:hypothetical protein Tco_0269478 [Tanacetum coccineum]
MEWRKEIKDCCKEAREAKIALRGSMFSPFVFSLGVPHVPLKFAEFLKEIQAKNRETMANLQILVRLMELNASHGSYGCAVSAIGYLRLIAELKALREVGYAVTSLNHIREIVGRESAKLVVLEQLSASTDVAMCLKDGYVTDLE